MVNGDLGSGSPGENIRDVLKETYPLSTHVGWQGLFSQRRNKKGRRRMILAGWDLGAQWSQPPPPMPDGETPCVACPVCDQSFPAVSLQRLLLAKELDWNMKQHPEDFGGDPDFNFCWDQCDLSAMFGDDEEDFCLTPDDTLRDFASHVKAGHTKFREGTNPWGTGGKRHYAWSSDEDEYTDHVAEVAGRSSGCVVGTLMLMAALHIDSGSKPETGWPLRYSGQLYKEAKQLFSGKWDSTEGRSEKIWQVGPADLVKEFLVGVFGRGEPEDWSANEDEGEDEDEGGEDSEEEDDELCTSEMEALHDED